MTGPNAAPESLELQLLREIQAEMRRRLHCIEEEIRGVVHEQQRLGLALGLARPTPPPGPHDSWATPDMGGR